MRGLDAPVNFAGVTRTGNRASRLPFSAEMARFAPGEQAMKGIVLWLLGVPIGVIILLYIFVFN